MQIGSNSLYDIGSNYSIKLNDKQILVVEDDPVAKDRAKAKELSDEKKQEEKKSEQAKKSNNPDELSEDEKRLVKDLATRDSEVKAHEAAHQAAGGGMTGAVSYTYQQGPDGKMYAIGGEVSISMPTGSTPEETIKNARQIAASAMAAGNPSPQDFAVASSARMIQMQAQQQKTKEMQAEQEEAQGKEIYSNEAKELNASSKNEDNLAFDISA